MNLQTDCCVYPHNGGWVIYHHQHGFFCEPFDLGGLGQTIICTRQAPGAHHLVNQEAALTCLSEHWQEAYTVADPASYELYLDLLPLQVERTYWEEHVHYHPGFIVGDIEELHSSHGADVHPGLCADWVRWFESSHVQHLQGGRELRLSLARTWVPGEYQAKGFGHHVLQVKGRDLQALSVQPVLTGTCYAQVQLRTYLWYLVGTHPYLQYLLGCRLQREYGLQP